MDEIVAEFVVESREGLDRLDADLLVLERDPGDHEALGSIFRTVHTIKGTCSFLGFATLESLAHTAENLLGKLRDGDLHVTEEIASALLATGDALRATLEAVERTGEEGDEDHTALLETLDRLHRGGDNRLGTLLIETGKVTAEDIERAVKQQQLLGDTRRLGEILVDSGKLTPEDVSAVLERQSATRGVGLPDTTVRVDVSLLDGLMELVEELAGVRDALVGLAAHAAGVPDGLAELAAGLDGITSGLHEGVMKTRLQPIGTAWSRLPRVVRDLAVQSGKQVSFEMEGEDVELDRSVVEAIRDPLTHLVRNAVDHGIEPPEERRCIGKPEGGRLALRAYQAGDTVSIEVADDGRGIDLEAVGRRAVERGEASAEEVACMGEAQLAALVFAPGLSTAAAVTNVSGRGVGMDVVRTNIERIGGAVDLRSVAGEGMTVRITVARPA